MKIPTHGVNIITAPYLVVIKALHHLTGLEQNHVIDLSCSTMSKISTTAAIPPDDQKCPEARGHSPDELSCAICTDIYKDPKLLHCMHSFCGACIEKMKHQEDEKPSVVCPICRFVTKVCIGPLFWILSRMTVL